MSRFISPKEFRYTLYKITKYYPDAVSQDKIYRWYNTVDNNKKVLNVEFGKNLIKNYESNNIPWYQKVFCCICKKKQKILFLIIIF